MGHRRWNAAVGTSLAIAALCALALFPTGAFAATASIQIKRVFYVAGAGEKNDLTISVVGENYILSDPGAQVTAGPGCTASDNNTAACPAAGITGITVSAGDVADNVKNATSTPSTLSGGDGNDSLAGGSGNNILRGNKGADTHAGGVGDDFIDSRGGAGDLVTCDIGNDTVNADGADSVDADCETVDRGGAPPPGPTSRPSPAAAALLGPAETRTLKPGSCATDILGTPTDDRLDGSALGDNLFGLQGNDILNGLRGNDCLFGGVGSDRMSGAEGDDRLLGDDSKSGVGGNDWLSGNAGNDLLVGGSGKDRLSGNDGNDRLYGGRGNDRLTGGRGRNRLRGGSGSDRLNGVNGRFDRLNCGPGRDTVRADRVDRVHGCERVHRRR